MLDISLFLAYYFFQCSARSERRIRKDIDSPMAKYEICLEEGDCRFVECDSMDEAEEMASAMVADPELDLVEDEDDIITYIDYRIKVTIKKCHDDDSDGDGEDEYDEYDEKNFYRGQFIHETEVPDKCPFCSCAKWWWDATYTEGSAVIEVSVCQKCEALREEKVYYGPTTGVEKEVSFIRRGGNSNEDDED